MLSCEKTIYGFFKTYDSLAANLQFLWSTFHMYCTKRMTKSAGWNFDFLYNAVAVITESWNVVLVRAWGSINVLLDDATWFHRWLLFNIIYVHSILSNYRNYDLFSSSTSFPTHIFVVRGKRKRGEKLLWGEVASLLLATDQFRYTSRVNVQSLRPTLTKTRNRVIFWFGHHLL